MHRPHTEVSCRVRALAPRRQVDLVARAFKARWRRLVKYASVSAISTATSLAVLGVLVGVMRLPSVASNVVAIAIGTVPSFELNRRWVWSAGGSRLSLGQVVPFCLLSFAGLLTSSVAVGLASGVTQGSGRFVHMVAVELANVGSYGALWLLQFLLCDRVLFKDRDLGRDASPQRAALQRAR